MRRSGGILSIETEVCRMVFEEKTNAAAQAQLTLHARNRLTVSGVKDVSGFDDASVELDTTVGVLIIRGRELKIQRLSIDGGARLRRGGLRSRDRLRSSGGGPPRSASEVLYARRGRSLLSRGGRSPAFSRIMAGRRLAQDIHAALSHRRSGGLVRPFFAPGGEGFQVYI